MKKFMLTLAVMAFACSTVMAQNQAPIKQHRNLKEQAVIEKHECKDHKDGQPCTKPADQQCDDCKAKAAAAPKHECKKGEGHECKEGMAPKHECKDGQKCDKAEGMKHECKEGHGPQCEREAMMKKHEECKDHKDGQACNKPADQQCPDCKDKAKKN